LKKVFFIVPSLTGGGAERVILHLLKNIDRSSFEPGLIVFEKKGDFVEKLPSDIKVTVLKGRWTKHGLFKPFIIFKLARVLEVEMPEAVVSFLWYPNLVTLWAKILSRTKASVIISERTSTPVYDGLFVNLLRSLAIRFFYPKADRIILPSAVLADNLVRLNSLLRGKMSVIHNPVDMTVIFQSARAEVEPAWYLNSKNVIIGIGRLSSEKGFPHLIKAVSLCHREGIDCRLVILGEGAERKTLENLVRELQLKSIVALPGFKDNPYKHLARSTVFVLSSLYEGFPNVLLEALALGVPSVATRCPTGPDEIITDGVNGILVPPADEKALAGAIKKVLSDEELRKRLSEAGRKRAEDFAVEKIVKQYEDAIESVCAGSAEN